METCGKERKVGQEKNGMEMRRLSDREGNRGHHNRAQMSELRRKNGQVACTASFERAIVEGTSVPGSYPGESAWPAQSTKRFLEEEVRGRLSLTSREMHNFRGGIRSSRSSVASCSQQHPPIVRMRFAVWQGF